MLSNLRKRSFKRVGVLAGIIAFACFLSATNPEKPDSFIIRTYEIDGLTYADYVSGDNSFRQVYIEDVPQHVKEGK